MEVWKIILSGKVQGVSFRNSVARFATERLIKLDGYAKNLATGEVEIVVKGESDALEMLLCYCTHGPRYANVKEIRIIKGAELSERYHGFSIS